MNHLFFIFSAIGWAWAGVVFAVLGVLFSRRRARERAPGFAVVTVTTGVRPEGGR